MAAKHVGLGRGLSALIKDSPASGDAPAPSGGIVNLPIGQVHKSPWQPRRTFETEALEDLVRSIRERGVLQPLLVRQTAAGEQPAYEVIAGERRLRAAQVAELTEVPVILMDVSDGEALELALIENLQREDLNIIEEAEGYRVLSESFELTQDDIATRVGKARATVANCLRLLGLPDSVKALVAAGDLSAGHAKVLLGLEIHAEQEMLARRTVKEGLSVRSLERLVAKLKRPPRKRRAERSDIPPDHVKYLTDRLYQHLGTSVRVAPCKTLANGKKAKGVIEIDYYSGEELDRLLVLLGLSEDL
jgi:ParB family chromosome partitioning protein